MINTANDLIIEDLDKLSIGIAEDPFLNKVLVFFVPSYFVDLIIKTAKDFFSYVSITFKFLDVDKQPFM
ncbi:MAG: hypothetical protein HQK92_09280 [Nitrospirae bacterium]|nr:hypothetical protein [Nitrospirota bacterium]